MEQRLKQALAQRQKARVVDASRTLSAVMVPIYCKQGQYYVLLTERTDNVRDHKGQLSFPGGAYEAGDKTLVNTALREASEEIGLSVDSVELLGELDDAVTTISNYIISPFVVVIPGPYPFRIDPVEVKGIIEVPLSVLCDRNCLRQESRIIEGREVAGYFYHYQGKVIWGATARILRQFLEIYAQLVENTER